MKKIKLFVNGVDTEVEKELNNFCKLHKVKDIKMSECANSMIFHRTIMVIYTLSINFI